MNDKDKKLLAEAYDHIVEISLTPGAPAPDGPDDEYNVTRDKKDQFDSRDPVPSADELLQLWDDGEGEEINIGYMLRYDIDEMFPSDETRELIWKEIKLYVQSYGHEAGRALANLIRTYFIDQHENWAHSDGGDPAHVNPFLHHYGLPLVDEDADDIADWWKG
jgi:hypothetical protein